MMETLKMKPLLPGQFGDLDRRPSPLGPRMSRPKLLSVVAAVAMLTLAVGVGSPKAAPVEIDFGALTPTGGLGACTHVTGDEGLVCANSLSFTANGTTFTATGYQTVTSDTFTTPTALTFKPEDPPVTSTPHNGYDESGLGENAIGPTSPTATACSDGPDCEIGGPGGTHGFAAVLIQSTIPMDDVVIGSVQTGEKFNVFAGNSTSTLTEIATGITGGSCTAGPMGATCEISGFSDTFVGVQSDGTGDVLVTGVSQACLIGTPGCTLGPPPVVPEPGTLAVLGSALAMFGIARRRKSV